jgi:DNA-binding LacI/PurR family transcriptional regulator
MGRLAGELLARRVDGDATPGESVQTAPAALVHRASTAHA